MRRFFLPVLIAAAYTNPSQIKFNQNATGSSSRSLAVKLAENASIADFGADPASSDNSTAITNCWAAAVNCYVPLGAFTITSTVSPSQDGQALIGQGWGSTIVYTGSSDAIQIAAPRRGIIIRDLAIRFTASTGATATAIHIAGTNSGAFRNVVDSVAIYQGSALAALLAPVTGQTGILLDSSGSTGGYFNNFSNVWIAGIDAPINCTSTCNQNHFVNIQMEQYGSGTNGYGFNFAGNNNTVVNATFSRGGSTATNVYGFFLNAGTYNQLSGGADVGVGSLWTGTIGTTNQICGTDSSGTPLTGCSEQQLSLGATPAAAGAIRMTNNTSIAWRDQANTANISITVDTNNRMKVGSAAAEVRLDNQIMEFGTGTVANSGVMRAAHATNFLGRNSANNANRTILDWGVGTADTLVVGDANMTAATLPAPTKLTNAVNRGSCTLGTNCATITVLSGAICTCADTTAAAACRVSVSGTTLTLTGTGTDVLNYTCL